MMKKPKQLVCKHCGYGVHPEWKWCLACKEFLGDEKKL